MDGEGQGEVVGGGWKMVGRVSGVERVREERG